MGERTVAFSVWAAIAVLASCVSSGHAQADPPEPAPAAAMTNQKLNDLLKKQFPADSIDGGLGFWRVELAQPPEPDPEANGKPGEEPEAAADEEAGPGADDHLPPVVLVITDERADRMRIMMPIRKFSPDREEDLRLALIALHANYDRALDARYAVHDGVLWSAFIHPLGSLTPADFENALKQVQTLRDNTGTSYSSSEFFFGPGEAPAEEPPAQPEENPEQPEEDDGDKVV